MKRFKGHLFIGVSIIISAVIGYNKGGFYYLILPYGLSYYGWSLINNYEEDESTRIGSWWTVVPSSFSRTLLINAVVPTIVYLFFIIYF